VDGLSRLAEGKSADNALRMSLSAYVLAARLEAVADSASDRLRRMSGGRYTLVHRDQGGAGRRGGHAGAGRRGGLGLAVVDAWTGRERETSTLSGGESFLASLSLALGLADVVTAEAGGAVLETLFVDEGFGSLDEDTIEEVMDVLDGLRSGGRTVGLVSHVAELRQRIPARVTVHKDRSGSSLRQT
jgi:exonuclease SbcC